jgi:hypothetical protein
MPGPAAGLGQSVRGPFAGLHAEFAGVDHGEVAPWIPEVAKTQPDWFTIRLVTA